MKRLSVFESVSAYDNILRKINSFEKYTPEEEYRIPMITDREEIIDLGYDEKVDRAPDVKQLFHNLKDDIKAVHGAAAGYYHRCQEYYTSRLEHISGLIKSGLDSNRLTQDEGTDLYDKLDARYHNIQLFVEKMQQHTADIIDGK